ncbi:MAG: radical SAM protein [candidate division WOR-3 bacterium]
MDKIINNYWQRIFPTYEAWHIKRIYDYPIITSSGCPFKCCFCQYSSGKFKWLPRSVNVIIEELKYAIKKYDIIQYTIWDSSFNATPEHLKPLCYNLLKNNIKLPFRCNGIIAAYLNEIDVQMLSQAGCFLIYIGVESLVSDIQKNVSKPISFEILKRTVELCHKHNILVVGSFIIGLPNDTFEKTMESYTKALECNLDLQLWSFAIPFPHTVLGEYVKKYGKYLRDYRLVPMGKGKNEYYPCFEYEYYPAAKMLTAFNKIYKETTLQRMELKKKIKSLFGKCIRSTDSHNIVWE